MSVTFQQNGEQLCVNVSIIDDQILESTEFFTVRPTSSDADVTIANSTATVVEITDNNDSKTWLVYFGRAAISRLMTLTNPGLILECPLCDSPIRSSCVFEVRCPQILQYHLASYKEGCFLTIYIGIATKDHCHAISYRSFCLSCSKALVNPKG